MPEAAERYGIDVARSGMALCPFHGDRHPSLYVADDHYHCFACGEHGDVIDFTAGLYGMPSYEAARKLAADFGITQSTADGSPAIAGLRNMAQQLREKEQLCLAVCTDYVRLLTKWKTLYAPKDTVETPNARYLEACRGIDLYDYYAELLLSGAGAERAELAERLTADGEIYKLQRRLIRLKQEDEQNERAV